MKKVLTLCRLAGNVAVLPGVYEIEVLLDHEVQT